MRRATDFIGVLSRAHKKFLSTLSLRRATPFEKFEGVIAIKISIHALLAESDYQGQAGFRRLSPFLSTLSLRRATHTTKTIGGTHYISIHALLAESDRVARTPTTVVTDFYPRSPCGERQQADKHAQSPTQFLSTLSLRRATWSNRPVTMHTWISIHALLAESDQELFRIVKPSYNFYPRSPCGERPKWTPTKYRDKRFLSTLSLRRATARLDSRQQPAGISIHALLAESDVYLIVLLIRGVLFLSTLSLRRATLQS